MSKIIFMVKGSAPDPYEVTFEKKGSSLRALCDCPAGIYNTYCKHRVNIICGCIDNIVSENKDEVSTVAAWFVGSDVEYTIDKIKEFENEILSLKKMLKGQKINLSKLLNG